MQKKEEFFKCQTHGVVGNTGYCHACHVCDAEKEPWERVFDAYYNTNEAGGSSRWLVTPDTVKIFIKGLIRSAIVKTETAFGGCILCYGKGYSTQKFAGKATVISFCKCERGKQLQSLFTKKKKRS